MPNLDRRSFLATGSVMELSAQGAMAASRGNSMVAGLRTAMRETPIGIDDRQPALSWRIEAGTGTMQAGYSIFVSSSLAELATTNSHFSLSRLSAIPDSLTRFFSNRSQDI